jgi:hypothetical protein
MLYDSIAINVVLSHNTGGNNSIRIVVACDESDTPFSLSAVYKGGTICKKVYNPTIDVLNRLKSSTTNRLSYAI